MQTSIPETGSLIPKAGSINAGQLEREALAALNAIQSSQDRATATQAEWIGEYLRRLTNTLDAFQRSAVRGSQIPNN